MRELTEEERNDLASLERLASTGPWFESPRNSGTIVNQMGTIICQVDTVVPEAKYNVAFICRTKAYLDRILCLCGILSDKNTELEDTINDNMLQADRASEINAWISRLNRDVTRLTEKCDGLTYQNHALKDELSAKDDELSDLRNQIGELIK